MDVVKNIIHYCGYSSQPYIDIYCTGNSHYVSWTNSNIENVYIADGLEKEDADLLYTFKLENVTCEDCLIKRNS